MRKPPLPIDAHLAAISASLSVQPNLILKASPGTGKTTRVPPHLMRDPRLNADRPEILVLEPRRLAAKLAAQRVAHEEQVRLGEEVGYHFRFENRTGPKTRLKFYTEGMLLRRLIGDPELRRASVVILDEFHERHLQTDLALSYLRWLQKERSSPIRIIVMSATLDTDALARYLGDAPVIEIQAQLHPVEQNYLPSPPAKRLEQLVRDAVAAELLSPLGDILVFLPGKAEIRRCEQMLAEFSDRASVLPLHGELSMEEQDRAIGPSERTKIILATNIAETSLTLPGVRTVIDSGLHRIASFSWWSGVPTLRTRPISKASAIQRAGRAGRLGPGRCLRLYPRGDFDSRAAFDVPEIHRADLTQAALELKSLGVGELRAFSWFDPPPAASLESSELLLRRLGACDPQGALTPIGRAIQMAPAHPRISRMLWEAAQRGVSAPAARLGAMIQEGELDELDAEECLRRTGGSERMRRAEAIFKELFAAKQPKARAESLGLSILAGFPDRVAKKRSASSPELLLSSGGIATISTPEKLGTHEYFIALDVFEQQLAHVPGKSQVQLRCVFPVEPEWLFELEPTQLKETREISWDENRKRAVLKEALSYGELVLSETLKDAEPSPETARLLAKIAWGLDISSVSAESWVERVGGSPEDQEKLRETLARAALFVRQEQAQPDFFSSRALTQLLETALAGKLSLNELRAIDWEQAILDYVESCFPGSLQKIQSLYPTHFAFPNGRRSRIRYSLTQPPWMESRLQDFFGLKRGPSIGNGKTILTLHLLAPNHRAVQITTDLPGFWQRVYPELRKQLSRRYPRHSWPEDPGQLSP